MSVAIISYDKKLIDNLPETNEIKVYNDTLSLIKDYQDNIKTIVYDSSSGIFAEDDLKYLIDKLANASIKYFVLTVPENPIDESSFNNNVIFTLKSEFSTLLSEIMKNIQQGKIQQEESLSNHITKIDDISQNFNDLANFEPDIISIEKDSTSDIMSTEKDLASNKESSLDSLHTPMHEIEYGDIEYGDIYINNESSSSIDIGRELEIFKEDTWDIEPTALTIDENLLQSVHHNFIESNEFYFKEDKTEELQNHVEHKEEKMEKDLITEHTTESTIQKVENNPASETENKITVANFNVSISSEDIKKLAMEMAKDILRNDNTLQTMIDHLQIDFQNEAMKELEEIKNQLKESVRQEADVMVKQEIEKLIKDELKEYVETVTTKIVRERLNAIFKENE